MRTSLFIILLTLLPAMAMAQARKDFKAAVAQFVQCYNNNDAGSLSSLFSPRSADRNRFTHAKLLSLKGKYRNIRSFSYARQREDGMIMFNVKFAKPRYDDPDWIPATWLGVMLDKDKKIVKLRFPARAYLNDEDRYLLNLKSYPL